MKVSFILSSIFLFLFIGRRFKDLTFGASAVLAMFHDTIILIGSFSILGHFNGIEIGVPFIYSEGECLIGTPEIEAFFKEKAGIIN